MNVVALFANIGGALAGLFRWLRGYEQRKSGRTRARFEAAVREAARAKESQKIDGEVRALDAGALERELRGKDAGD